MNKIKMNRIVFSAFLLFHLPLLLISAKMSSTNLTMRPQYDSLKNSSRRQSFAQQSTRRQRSLLFEKGATFLVQTNIGKAIISEYPRGLNTITEYTITYDLPYELFRPLHRKHANAKPSTTSQPPTSTIGSYNYESGSRTCAAWNFNNYDWQPKRLWCNRRHLDKEHSQFTGGRFMRQASSNNRSIKNMPWQNTIFFDLVHLWANIHDYNGRQCIRRTLCEAPHFLLPSGASLLHDLLRILLSFTAHRSAGYHSAMLYAPLPPPKQMEEHAREHARNAAMMECARLYGPHCRTSFLQHIDTAIHNKINEAGN